MKSSFYFTFNISVFCILNCFLEHSYECELCYENEECLESKDVEKKVSKHSVIEINPEILGFELMCIFVCLGIATNMLGSFLFVPS